MKEGIEKAIEILKQGGIVIFPTDTAFGIGCRVDDEKAVKRLFEIRKRPESQAAPVLVNSMKMAQKYLKPIDPDITEKLIKPYWPGALTIVFPCLEIKVPSLVRAGGNTLGMRMPDHESILEIISRFGIPVLGPSANFHGEQTPFKFEDLNKELIKKVDYVVHGECKIKEASTVVDCSEKPWRIIREGAVRLEL